MISDRPDARALGANTAVKWWRQRLRDPLKERRQAAETGAERAGISGAIRPGRSLRLRSHDVRELSASERPRGTHVDREHRSPGDWLRPQRVDCVASCLTGFAQRGGRLHSLGWERVVARVTSRRDVRYMVQSTREASRMPRARARGARDVENRRDSEGCGQATTSREESK